MPEITRLNRGAVDATGGAQQSPAELGLRVLLALQSQPTTTSMSVPTDLLKDLAGAIVQLAETVAHLSAERSTATAAPKSASPTLEAKMVVTSVFFDKAKKRAHCEELAGKVRLECAELGIKLNVSVSHDFYTGWYVDISGQAPKTKLDAVRAYITGEISVFGEARLGKLDVQKYDIV